MTPLITFPSSTGLPYSVAAAWGIFAPGRPRDLFCLQTEEASCIDVYEPISQFHIAIVQGCKNQCQEWVNTHFKLTPQEFFHLETDAKASTFTRQKSRLIIIWLSLPSIEDAVCIFSILAHECLHAAYAIMDGMGMKPDFANEEFTAYAIQFLMNNYVQSIGHPLPHA